MSSLQAVVVFNLFMLGMLALDLGVFHRRAHAISFREASLRSGFWVVLSLAFNLGLYFWRGPQPALEFLTGYILEKSLSIDNVFLFAVIFSTMGLPPPYQHKVLFWGVLGALAMRAVLIGTGVALISRFGWILYIFGIFLVITGATLLRRQRQPIRPERNPLLRLARRVFPITEDYKGASFFLRRNGRLCATPLFLVLLMIETTDVVLALDSIPAVLAITQDPFIIYTSNAFAILGLRALYFLLAGAMEKLRYLRVAVSVILIFVGAKMLLAHFYKVPVLFSLLVICVTLGISVLASLRPDRRSIKRLLVSKTSFDL